MAEVDEYNISIFEYGVLEAM